MRDDREGGSVPAWLGGKASLKPPSQPNSPPPASCRLSPPMASTCQACYAQKAKCERVEPSDPCNRCSRAGRECVSREGVVDRRRREVREMRMKLKTEGPIREDGEHYAEEESGSVARRRRAPRGWAGANGRTRTTSNGTTTGKIVTNGSTDSETGSDSSKPSRTRIKDEPPDRDSMDREDSDMAVEFHAVASGESVTLSITADDEDLDLEETNHQLALAAPSRRRSKLKMSPGLASKLAGSRRKAFKHHASASASMSPSAASDLLPSPPLSNATAAAFSPDSLSEPADTIMTVDMPFGAATGTGPSLDITGSLGICLNTYWNFINTSNPLIHRQTFEDAIVGSTKGAFAFGPNPPYALLFAMAGAGAVPSEELGHSVLERTRLARAYCGLARDMVLSARISRGDGSSPMSDLEAGLTTFLVYMTLAGAGQVHGGHIAVQYVASILNRLEADPVTSVFSLVSAPPATAQEWVFKDMALRLWILLSAPDAAMGHWSGRELFLDYFAPRKFPLPAHEVFFEHTDVEEAFQLLPTSTNPGTAWPTVDFEPFTSRPSIETARDIARAFVLPVVSHRASSLVLMLENSFLRDLRRRLRAWLAQANVDTVAMMVRNPDEYSPAEFEYRNKIAIFDAVIEGTFDSLPPDIGPSLAIGNSAPFFALQAHYFPGSGHAHMALALLMALRTLPMEHYIRDNPTDGGPSFFTSPEFLRILESTVLFSRLLDGKIAVDPTLQWVHYFHMSPGSRAGALLLAVIRILRAKGGPQWVNGDTTGLANDIRAISRLFDAIGHRLGLAGHFFAEDFKRQMLDADVPLEEPRLVNVDEDEEAEGRTMPLRFVVSSANDEMENGELSKVFTSVAISAENSMKGFYGAH